MNLYIYSDESGVFDKIHNNFYVYGGIICLNKEQKNSLERMYKKAESTLRQKNNINKDLEIKASNLNFHSRNKLFRSLNKFYKFGVIIHQEKVNENIFNSKKDKQRYLNYAYKIALKRALQNLIKIKKIDVNEKIIMNIFCDQHTTATNGIYELREALEKEFSEGTNNFEANAYYPPIFKNKCAIQLKYCNSLCFLPIRAADIVSNKIFYYAKNNKHVDLNKIDNMFCICLPYEDEHRNKTDN